MMSAETAAVLRRAAELIAEPERGGQGSYVRYLGSRREYTIVRCAARAIRDAVDFF